LCGVRLVAFCLLGVGLIGTLAIGGRAGSPSYEAREAVDLIVVPDSEPWLLAVAAPLAKRLAANGPIPLLLSASARSKPEVSLLVQRAGVRTALVLSSSDGPQWAQGLGKSSPGLVPPGARPLEASLRIARRYWGTSGEVVLATLADPESVILGSVLAVGRGVPLLVVEKGENQTAVAKAIEDLGAERVAIAGGTARPLPAWRARLGPQTEILDTAEIQRRIIAGLQPAKIRNVILSRVPQGKKTGQAAWLAPYLSAVRHAPVVLVPSSGAAEAETQVRGLIERGGLRPRTLTILADYRSIGTSVATIARGADPSGPQGDVAVEPCAPKSLTETATLGIGRIPFVSVEDASLLVARGIVRERLVGGQPSRLVMVANPVLAGRPLPLCEAISRVTVAEFKNFGLEADEFYNRAANSPEVLAAARTANLIVYEGHIEDQELFRPRRRVRATGLRAGADGAAEKPLAAAPLSEPPSPLDGLPVVILQSCDSLHGSVLDQVHQSGGVALVGTSTPVHSTSGSAFVKAVADGLLYRGDTLGEALCDARNYFACLQDLKDLRGHTQQAKSQRVALSFRLWGDPELRVFPEGLASPRKPPVSARWDNGGKVVIALPGRRLPEARNDKYVVHVFPGSEAAGMVRGVAGQSARRLTPLYFFKMPLPEGFAKAGYNAADDSGGARRRAVLRVDPLERFMYVLYYPAGERPNRTYALQLVRRSGGPGK
jgi:hypothetical protein